MDSSGTGVILNPLIKGLLFPVPDVSCLLRFFLRFVGGYLLCHRCRVTPRSRLHLEHCFGELVLLGLAVDDSSVSGVCDHKAFAEDFLVAVRQDKVLVGFAKGWYTKT